MPGGFGINDVMGVRRGPSRGVSLGDVRDLPVQMMGFGEDASAGRIRGPQPHTDQRLWGKAEGTGNDVGMGRLSGYSERDIKRWYLHHEMDLEGEFSEETGEKIPETEAENQRLVDEASAEAVSAAEEEYEADREAWEAETSRLSAMAGEDKRPWELTEAEKRANRQREKKPEGDGADP